MSSRMREHRGIALPPGPRSSAVAQLLHYTLSPLSFLNACHRRYGDTFTVRWAAYGTFVMFSSPSAVRDVFRGDPHALHAGEANEFISVTVGAHSVLVLDDDLHSRQRRVLLPPLKGTRMRSHFEAMQAATIGEMARWPRHRPIRMDEPMRRITLRVIVQAVLGLSPGPSLDEFVLLIERLLATTRSRFSLILMKVAPLDLLQRIPRLPYFHELRQLDRALYGLLAARRSLSPELRGDNVIADLLAATHEDGRGLTDLEIRDAVVTLLVAGHETTALALAWAVERIASHPTAIARIAEEIERVTGGEIPTAENLGRLEYLDAAIRESLRTRTILPFVVRLAKKPFVAGGREYPAGVMLSPCNHLVHHRPDIYPSPEKFRPERFLERTYAAHEWFPFGGGNRVCLGMAFALYEMKVVLSTMLSRLHLVRPPGSRSHPVRRGITLAPNDGAAIIVTDRR